MKIRKVTNNNKKRCFEIETAKRNYYFPHSRLRLKPSADDKIVEIYADPEIGREGLTYRLESGKEDTIHIDPILEYNRDPDYLRDMLLYRLTVKAQKLLESKKISKREVIRRLGTSPTQFYRLIDQTFYKKTIDQMIKLLAALDCTVDIVFKKAA